MKIIQFDLNRKLNIEVFNTLQHEMDDNLEGVFFNSFSKELSSKLWDEYGFKLWEPLHQQLNEPLDRQLKNKLLSWK